MYGDKDFTESEGKDRTVLQLRWLEENIQHKGPVGPIGRGERSASEGHLGRLGSS